MTGGSILHRAIPVVLDSLYFNLSATHLDGRRGSLFPEDYCPRRRPYKTGSIGSG